MDEAKPKRKGKLGVAVLHKPRCLINILYPDKGCYVAEDCTGNRFKVVFYKYDGDFRLFKLASYNDLTKGKLCL